MKFRKIDCQSARLDDIESWSALAPNYKNALYALCRYWDIGFHSAGGEAQFDLRKAKSREYFWRRESTNEGIFLKGFKAADYWSDASLLSAVLDELIRSDWEPFDDRIDLSTKLPLGHVYDPWRPVKASRKSPPPEWNEGLRDWSESV